MPKSTLRTSEVRSSLLALQKRVSEVQDQIDGEAAFHAVPGNREAAATLVDLGSLVSNFAKHIDMCTEAWDEFAAVADAKLQQLNPNVTSSH
jgi:hypothetical protein